MTERDGRELSDVIRYAVNSEKTQQAENEDCTVVHRFVSGINCSPATARDEMLAVKKRFGKENGTVAYHGYQSFAPGEVTPETAHEIGMKLAARLWGDRYQVIVATHLDKENHLHNHFVPFPSAPQPHGRRNSPNDKICTFDIVLRFGYSIIKTIRK